MEALLTPGRSARPDRRDHRRSARQCLVLTFNVPRYIVEACHARGMQVMALCGSVGRAVAAEAAGVDYIVAQGAEGGGHRLCRYACADPGRGRRGVNRLLRPAASSMDADLRRVVPRRGGDLVRYALHRQQRGLWARRLQEARAGLAGQG